MKQEGIQLVALRGLVRSGRSESEGESGFKPESEFKPEQEGFKSGQPLNDDRDLAINGLLWEHQEGAVDWSQARTVESFHRYIKAATPRFELNVPLPVIDIENLEVRTVSKYYAGRNGLGLRHQITVNSRYLIPDDPIELVRVLASMTACLLQAHLHENAFRGKQASGRVDYFPAQLVREAERLGIRIDTQGRVYGVRSGPFLQLLAENGLKLKWQTGDSELRFQPASSKLRRKTGVRTGLRKWVCPCGVILRHAGDDLKALCLHCKEQFRIVSPEDEDRPIAGAIKPAGHGNGE